MFSGQLLDGLLQTKGPEQTRESPEWKQTLSGSPACSLCVYYQRFLVRVDTFNVFPPFDFPL